MADTKASANNFAVVIAIDASQQAEYAIKYYFEHLHKKKNKIVLVHVIELPDMAHARQVYLSPSALAELWKEEQEKCKRLQEHLTDVIKSHGVMDVTLRTQGGTKPGQVIIATATEEKASMIVIGTRGMGKIRRTVLGSVSDYVVHHSACPVIVVRHPTPPAAQIEEKST